jgi:hypothetical protein
MARVQRPHWALQPRQAKSWLVVVGVGSALSTVRTSWSLNTLQEQMIMEAQRYMHGYSYHFKITHMDVQHELSTTNLAKFGDLSRC